MCRHILVSDDQPLLFHYPEGVNFPRSLIQLLESVQILKCLKIQVFRYFLDTRIFKGVKWLRFPPVKTFQGIGCSIHITSSISKLTCTQILLKLATYFKAKFITINTFCLEMTLVQLCDIELILKPTQYFKLKTSIFDKAHISLAECAFTIILR